MLSLENTALRSQCVGLWRWACTRKEETVGIFALVVISSAVQHAMEERNQHMLFFFFQYILHIIFKVEWM